MAQLKPKFLILTGDGINCENETKFAFTAAGADSEIFHINELMKRPQLLNQFQGMAFPGGFSFGDELGSGQVLALKVKKFLINELSEFVERKRPIIGICNGFQVLTKLGFLPDPHSIRSTALAHNTQGQFLDRWTEMSVNKESVCKWTLSLKNTHINLPVRHGEGRVVFSMGKEKEIYDNLLAHGQIPFQYSEDINGSYQRIAGLCDPSGLILGMMPHPEAAVYNTTSPLFDAQEKEVSDGYFIFKSIVEYLGNS